MGFLNAGQIDNLKNIGNEIGLWAKANPNTASMMLGGAAFGGIVGAKSGENTGILGGLGRSLVGAGLGAAAGYAGAKGFAKLMSNKPIHPVADTLNPLEIINQHRFSAK